jgi:hypothetical protein
MLLTALALAFASTDAEAAPIPLPVGGYTVDHDQAQVQAEVSDDATAGMVYAYADVSHNRVVTAGPLDRRDLAHEVCHILDWQTLTDTDRAVAARIMGSPARGWFDYEQMRGDGAEWFADYCSAVAVNLDPRPHRVKVGIQTGDDSPFARITYKRLRAFKWFLYGIGVREHLSSSSF